MHILQAVLAVGIAVACLVVGLLVGRRWKRQYRGAVALRAQLEADNKAMSAALSSGRADAAASAHGNVVVIGDGSVAGSQRDVPAGSSSFWLPAAARSRLNSGPDVRKELGSGLGVPERLDDVRGPGSDRVLSDAYGAAARYLDADGVCDEDDGRGG